MKKTAKKQPTSGSFKPGQCGNPSGRPRLDPVVLEARKVTQAEFIDGLLKYGHMTRKEIQEVAKDQSKTMFDLLFCKLVATAADGNKDARALLIERLWGKVKDTPTEPTGPVENVIVNLPSKD